jgi:hypothetical protein
MSIEKVHNWFLSSKLLLSIIVLAFISVQLYPVINHLDNLTLWGSLLIQMAIAFFLLQLNHIFNIIQKRTFLPALFYLLFIGSNPDFYNEIEGSIAALCVVLSFYFLFNCNQNPQSQTNALNISLLLVLGSVLQTSLLLLFPIFWMGFYHFKCFNARVFFANLVGIPVVYLFIFALSLFQGDKNIFFSLLPQFDVLFAVQKPDLTIFEWVTYGLLAVYFVIVSIYLFFFNISERIWTIAVLRFFYFSTLVLFIFYLLQSEYKSTWGLIIYIPIAFVSGHYFSKSNNKSVHYLLLFSFLFFIGIGFARHIST